jgi:hypothetical protein
MDPKIWQTFGRAVLAGGAVVIAIGLYMSPHDHVNTTRMAVGLAGSFMALAGIACLSAGAVMTGSQSTSTWKMLGALGEGIGLIVVLVAAWRGMKVEAPTWNHVAIGLAGAFTLMAGVLCNLTGQMLGNRAGESKSTNA